MNTVGTENRSIRWFEKILSREDWVYLLALLAPILVFNVTLKLVRIFGQADVPGALMFLDQIRSDIFFNLGFAALWIGLFAAFRSGIFRSVLLVVFHLSCMLLLILTTASHFYYETTGSPLDYGLIALTFENFSEISAVISSEVTTVRMLLLSAVLMYGIAGPAVVTRLFFRDWHIPVGSGEALPEAAPLVGRRASTLAVGVLTVALIFLSTLPSMTGTSNSFTRDTIVNLVITEVASAQIDESRVAKKVAAENLPTDAKLVETPDTEKKNVVMVFLESERASATTPYNPELDTTPVLEELSKNSLMAENAYAVVPHTSKSMTAANCAMEPPLDTKMTESEPDGIPAQCLPDLLKEQGYNTAFFQSATENFERRRDLVANFGYDEFYPLEALPKTDDLETVNYFGYEDDVMLEPSRQWIEKNKNEPFLATYLTVTTHHDYNVPKDFPKKRYVEDDRFNDYLNTVAYQDRFLGKLIQQYKDAGLYEDTIFVVMADHGEGFSEHDLNQHDNTIYNEGTKIPFLIHDPSRFQGGEKIVKPIQNMVVLPTVADLLGYRIENDTYHGKSLLRPEQLPDRLRVSCWNENRCMALIEGDQKYIYQFSDKAEEFYDLSEDPDEKNDILNEKSDEEIRAMRYDLLEWQALVRATYERHLADVSQEETTMGSMEGS